MRNHYTTFFNSSILMITVYPSAHHYQIYHARVTTQHKYDFLQYQCNGTVDPFSCGTLRKLQHLHHLSLPLKQKMSYCANNAPLHPVALWSNYDILSSKQNKSWKLKLSWKKDHRGTVSLKMGTGRQWFVHFLLNPAASDIVFIIVAKVLFLIGTLQYHWPLIR